MLNKMIILFYIFFAFCMLISAKPNKNEENSNKSDISTKKALTDSKASKKDKRILKNNHTKNKTKEKKKVNKKKNKEEEYITEKDSDDVSKKEKRSVIVFDIENTSRDKNLAYLSSSLPSSFTIALKNSEKFRVFPRSKLQEYLKNSKLTNIIDEASALKVAADLNIEIAVVGNFFTDDQQIEINLRAVDVYSKRTKIIDNAKGETGIEIYDLIDKISASMLDKMVKALPPMAKEEIIRQRLKEEKIYVEKVTSDKQFSISLGALSTLNWLNSDTIITNSEQNLKAINTHFNIVINMLFSNKNNEFSVSFNLPGIGNEFIIMTSIQDTLWIFKRFIGINMGIYGKGMELINYQDYLGNYSIIGSFYLMPFVGIATELFKRIRIGYNLFYPLGIPAIAINNILMKAADYFDYSDVQKQELILDDTGEKQRIIAAMFLTESFRPKKKLVKTIFPFMQFSMQVKIIKNFTAGFKFLYAEFMLTDLNNTSMRGSTLRIIDLIFNVGYKVEF